MFRIMMDLEIRYHKMRPPCPRCKRRTWMTRGLDDQPLFRCFIHGHWLPEPLENDQGERLPFFRWRLYDWRLL